MEVMTEENIRRIKEELLSDRRLTLKEISVRTEVPKTTVIRIIREHLHVKKVSARWVPRLLSSISVRMEVPKTTVIRIIREHLHVKKVSARWVARLLSSVQKEHCLTCQKILELCRGIQKQVLKSFVPGDETMVLYYNSLSKRESVEWRKPGEAPPRKVKVTQSAKKIMATTFWDCRGILID